MRRGADDAAIHHAGVAEMGAYAARRVRRDGVGVEVEARIARGGDRAREILGGGGRANGNGEIGAGEDGGEIGGLGQAGGLRPRAGGGGAALG